MGLTPKTPWAALFSAGFCAGLCAALAVGCSNDAPTVAARPVSTPVEPTAEASHAKAEPLLVPNGSMIESPVQGAPVSREALAGAVVELSALVPRDQDLVTEVLNVVPAPCGACDRTSIARCALSMPSECERLPSLVQRALRVAAEGTTKERLESVVSYPDIWVKIPDQGRMVDPPKHGPILMEVWLDPSGPMLGGTVGTIDQLDLTHGGIIFRYLTVPGDALSEDIAKATMAVQDQGQLEAFLRALLVWKEAHRTVGGGSGELSLAALAEVVVSLPGVALATYEAARSSEAIAARLAEDRALAARIEVRSAPSFFVNGYRLRGAQSASALNRLISLELLDHPELIGSTSKVP